MKNEFDLLRKDEITFRSPDAAILELSKAKLETIANELQSDYDPLTEILIWKKLKFFIEQREAMLKDKSCEEFLERYGGSQTEREAGFVITLKDMPVYEYSDRVTKVEKIIAHEQAHLKELKEDERKNNIAKKLESKSILSFTLK